MHSAGDFPQSEQNSFFKAVFPATKIVFSAFAFFITDLL